MNPNGNGATPTALPGTVPDRLQPHNIEAEEAVLGSLIIDPDAILRIAALLNADDFFVARNGWLYDAILDLHDRREPADLVTLTTELRQRGQLKEIGGPARLTGLINATPSSTHIKHYAKIVADTAARRRLITAAGKISRLAHQDTSDTQATLDQSESIIFGATTRQHISGFKSVSVGVDEVIDRVEYLYHHSGQVSGLPTGLRDLDRLLGGLQRSDLIILAGRPSMGKTALAINIAQNAAKKFGTRVGVFSMETSLERLTQRMIGAESGIDTRRLRTGKLTDEEWSEFVRASNQVAEMPIQIDDTASLTVLDLRSRARRLHAELGLGLLIVDYLQLINGLGKKENRQQEVSFMSRQLKALARELNIPILALSQLSRECEKRHNKRPMLSDLRESGSIEQDADVVLFIYQDEAYNPDTEFPNLAEIILGKQRDGPTGILSTYFKKHITLFVDLEIRRQNLNDEPEYEAWKKHV